MINKLMHNIITQLNDGNIHSGEALGAHFSVSRTAIWKYINQLQQLGLPIIKHANTGYQLQHPFIFLNEQTIIRQLSALSPSIDIKLHLVDSVDSTNRLIKQLPYQQKMDIVCAETQTSGRGRFGRLWHSPFGESLLCSSRWHFDSDIASLSGLSLVVGLSVLKTLTTLFNAAFQIKWPNDILWQEQKLAGILLEIQADDHLGASVIIGIGINVNNLVLPVFNTPSTSLYRITGQTIDRNLLLATLISQLDEYIQCFKQQGFEPFVDEWEQYDYLKGKTIAVAMPNKTIKGVASGVLMDGRLIVKEYNDTVHWLSLGEATILK